tara:strand:+ start:910 stop:1341 length:432 start_codon:yes stop_codon:yes gene_type:complete
MRHIYVTNIDATTGIICTEAAMQTGPSLPYIKGFEFIFQNESEFPIGLNSNGSYIAAPLIYGTCDDDADTSVVGVLKTLTANEFEANKQTEHLARKPYPSWVGDISEMSWDAPTPYPEDGNNYYWNEPTISWVALAVSSTTEP